MIKKLFVFDLDDTLGPKKPFFPGVTPENAAYLKQLSADSSNLLCIATSRPKQLAYLGFKNAGLLDVEVKMMFPVGVYEDGFLVEVNEEKVYNVLDSVPDFVKLKKVFFDLQTVNFFKENGFLLHLGDVGEGFSFPKDLVVIQKQHNDVKAVYRSYPGFMDDDLDKQAPYFQNVKELAEQNLDSRFPNWREIAELVVWKDAVDLYPKLSRGIYLKGHGLEIALPSYEIPNDVQVYICGDGKNDIQMVEWAAGKFKNYKVVCPSNLSPDLRDFLALGNYNHKVLDEDCTRFCEGLKRLL